ncbi:MAG: porin [Deltaproteobacteria bacterium]|nr:porin [Deltaproteobacteria bacterium]
MARHLVLFVALFVAIAAAWPGSAAAQGKDPYEETKDKTDTPKTEAAPVAATEATPEAKAEVPAEKKAEPAPAPAEEEKDTDTGAAPAPTPAPEAAPAVEAKEEVVEPVPTPAPATAPEKKIVQGTWTKKLVFATDDGLFSFQPTGFVQPMYLLHIAPDATDELAGSGFLLKRARFGFKAGLFKLAQISLDADFKDGTAALVDYYLDLDPFNGLVVLRVGRFREWFCRQVLMGSTRLQMVDNAQAWAGLMGLGNGRDLGAAVHGMIVDTIEYGVGIWNGEKTYTLDSDAVVGDQDVPANIDYEMGGRLVIHPLSAAGVGAALPVGEEPDLDGAEKPKLAVGGALLYNKRHDRVVALPTNGDTLYYDNQLKGGVELGFQWMGASLLAEFFALKTWVQSDADAAIKDAVPDLTGMGAYGQLGYFVLPHQLEAAARFDFVDKDVDIQGAFIYPAFGLNYYFFGHNLKAQLMYRMNRALDPVKKSPDDVPTTHDVFLMLQGSI